MLDVRRKDGTTRREALEKARKQLKQAKADCSSVDEQLKPVEVPYCFNRLLSTFWFINTGRSEGVNGFLPISFSEIKAFCELTDEPLTPWEVETLKVMDRVFLDEIHKLNEEQK